MHGICGLLDITGANLNEFNRDYLNINYLFKSGMINFKKLSVFFVEKEIFEIKTFIKRGDIVNIFIDLKLRKKHPYNLWIKKVDNNSFLIVPYIEIGNVSDYDSRSLTLDGSFEEVKGYTKIKIVVRSYYLIFKIVSIFGAVCALIFCFSRGELFKHISAILIMLCVITFLHFLSLERRKYIKEDFIKLIKLMESNYVKI